MAKIKIDKEGRIEENRNQQADKLHAEEPKLIIESKIKSAVPELQVSSDVAAELNKKVISLLEEGSKRAKANGRRTLYARDL